MKDLSLETISRKIQRGVYQGVFSQAMPNLSDEPREWTRSVTNREGHEEHFVISTNRSLLSIPSMITAFSADFIYWARPIPADSMQLMLEKSLCYGIYKSTPSDPNSGESCESTRKLEQIGFTRLITDYVTFVYLCDVYIVPEYQGAGLGTWMVNIIQDEMDQMQYLRRLILMTRGDRTKKYYERLLGVEMMGTVGQAYILGKIGAGSCV